MSPARRASIDLDAVAGALAQLGVEHASGAALARAAGVAKPTLYARFGSRAALVEACIQHEAERLLDHLYEADEPAAAVAAYARASSGWPLLLLSRYPVAIAARVRVTARIAEGVTPPPGLSTTAAAHAFLAAAAAVLELERDADSLSPLARALLHS